MPTSVEFSAEGRMNTKRKRLQSLKRSIEHHNAPDSYKNNSTKEELCFEYVRAFQEQYRKFYPKRKKLFMTAENEFGVKKFVCSTIRPIQLPYAELYDMYECASFLAGYILYEPLDPPAEFPPALFSPTQTLGAHIGDSFDLATLLCSFLIGNGYDAYVVCGYAPKFITLRDQCKTICPMISSIDQNSPNSSKSAAEQPEVDDNTASSSSYVAPDTSVKDSKFIISENELKRIAALDPFRLWIPEEMGGNNQEEQDGGVERLHAWVFVAGGRRDVREHTFLEPSTGRAYNVGNSPYFRVEALWNNTNYWVNKAEELPVAKIDFDLNNSNFWEFLFISPYKPSTDEGNNGDADNEDADHDKAAAEAAAQAENLQLTRTFDAPPTWVAPIMMDRKQYLLQYPPHGKRTVQYFRAKADFFARGVNAQSMVMRIVLYLDVAQTIVSEVHEWFDNRKDKLYKRVRKFLGQQHFVEHYHPASIGEIKTWTEYPGKRIEVDFYVNGRLDRLVRREEIIGESVKEFFEGRSDHLVFRSVLFTVEKATDGSRQIFTLPGGTLAHDLFVIKMTQSFEKDPQIAPGSDIAKRSFFVREGKAVVRYHFEKGQISGKVKTYLHTRGPNVAGVSELALTQEVGIEEDMDQLQEAIALERDCYASIKANFQQMQKISEFRESTESGVVMEFSVFDMALDKALGVSTTGPSAQGTTGGMDRGGGGTEKDAKASTDYLTPFLRTLKDPLRITKEEALEIRQNCLDALKARLVERANIIQSRLNEENANLGRRQEHFQRSQREGDLSTEDYEKYCTDAMFRIQILEQRLVAHEEAALKKFAELDTRLANDPRLRVLKN